MSLRSEVIRIVNELTGNSKKISELPAATTPLTGTELMEVVQGGISKRVAKSDVSSGGGGGGGTAATTTFTPAGSIVATNVQTAIQELDTEKEAVGVAAGLIATEVTDRNAAILVAVPSQATHSGKVLQTNGTVTSWQTPSGAGDSLISEGALINSATTKATPVDADFIGLMDSAASNILKKLSWANVKATLKTYFDTLYQAAGSYLTSANIVGTITNGATTTAPSEDAVFDALALKAPLASPTFTGTVTVPTPTTATGASTKLYTDNTAFINAIIFG